MTNDLGSSGGGGAKSDSDNVAITVTAVNDAPTATIVPASYSATEQIPLALHGTGLSVADVDAGAAMINMTLAVDAGNLIVAAGTTGVSISGSGTSSVFVIGTLTQLNDLLSGNLGGSIRHLVNSDAPPASVTFTLAINDGGATGAGGIKSGSDTAQINITAVNDAPVNTVPGAQTTNEDTALVFNAGTNPISIGDPDAGSSAVQVTLTATNGTMILNGTTGLTFSLGDGVGDPTMTFTGTVTNINSALNGMMFTPTANYFGAASLQIVTNDQGNTGSGGAKSDTDTVNITVNPVADTPSVTNATTDEDTQSTSGLIISRNAADGAEVTHFKITGITNGTLFKNDGVTPITNGTFITFAEGNAGLKFTPTADFSGSGSFTVQASTSSGDAGLGGSTVIATVTVNAVNDAPVITSDGGGASATISIAENLTAVSTVTSTDPDGGAPVYSIAGGADAARFTINSSAGVLSFLVAPDYESPTDAGGNNVYDVIVQVSDGAGGMDTQAIAVAVTPVNDTSPVITSDGGGAAASVNVAENTTAVTTVIAIDADVPSPPLTYSIAGGADAAMFTIDGSSGSLSLISGRDRESPADADSNGIYEVTVQVSDGTFSDSQAIRVTITDVDEFDVGAVTDGDATANAVNENAANGTAVGIAAAASDADATTNAITYSLDDNAGGRFAIDSSTGVVTVAGAIDRETAASYNVTVRATSADTSFSTQTFTIAVNDVDEFDVGPVTDSDATANAVNENAANGTAVGIAAAASDADATTNAIAYSLDDDAGGRFAINATTGVVTVNATLDYETATSYSVTIRATSTDGSHATQSFTISVTDVNESGITAISDTDAAADAVLENASAGTPVGVTAFADDPDGTDTVSYTLDDDAGGQFAIDPATGVVTVVGAIDREAGATRSITVRATSDDGSTTTQTYTIAINDLDEFDITPISDSDVAADTVDENAAVGTAVGITALASDGDATTNGITYSLDDDAGGQFAIDPTTGVLTVAGAIDREAGATRSITVRATSDDGSTATQTYTIAINDLDEFDITPINDSDATADAVDENAAVGTAVGITALASDGDATTNGITYSLDDDAGGQFAIDPTTGVVTVAGAIDREAGATRSITIRATSDDGSTATQSYTIAINDLDEFDITPITDSDATADAVDENAALGTAVGITALASDGDATTNGITYSLDDDAGGQFAIDPTTGVVTVAGAIDREAGATRSITIRATSDDGSTTTQSYTIASTTWTNSTSRPSTTATRRPMRWTRTQRWARPWGSRPWPATATRRPTASPTRWTTTPADNSPSIRRPAW